MDDLAFNEIEYLKGLEGVVAELNSFCNSTGEFKCTVLFYLLKLELLNVKDLDTFNNIEVLWDNKSKYYSINAHGFESTIFKSRNTFPSEFCGFEQGDVPTVTFPENLGDAEADDSIIGFEITDDNPSYDNPDEIILPVIPSQNDIGVGTIEPETPDTLNIIKEEPNVTDIFVENLAASVEANVELITEDLIKDSSRSSAENDANIGASEFVATEIISSEKENHFEIITAISSANDFKVEESSSLEMVRTGTLKVPSELSDIGVVNRTVDSWVNSTRAQAQPRQIIVKEKNVVPSYPCLSCEKTFMLLHQLKRHQKTHMTEKLYNCELCNKGFNDENNLRVHKKKQHEDKKWNCSICRKGYLTEEKMLNHEKLHKRATRVKCDVCGKSFNSSKTFKEHKLMHKSKKKYSCEMCGWAFSEKSLLNFHHKQFHSDPSHQNENQPKTMNEDEQNPGNVPLNTVEESPEKLASDITIKIEFEKEDVDTKKNTVVDGGQDASKSVPDDHDDATKLKIKIESEPSTQVTRSLRAQRGRPRKFDDFVVEVDKKKSDESKEEASTTEMEDQGLGSDTDYKQEQSQVSKDTDECVDDLSGDESSYEEPKKKRKLSHGTDSSPADNPEVNKENGTKEGQKEAHDIPDVVKENQDPLATVNAITEQEKIENFINHVYKCLFCTDEFSQVKPYEDHVVNVHNEEEIPYLCSVCPKTFYTRNRIKRHWRCVHGPPIVACDVCHKTFTENCELKRHMKIHNDHSVICEECGKCMKSLHALEAHKKTHLDMPPIDCEFCDRKFSSKRAFEFHMKCHQSSIPLPQCEHCGKELKSRTQLAIHKRKCVKKKKSQQSGEDSKMTDKSEDKSAYRCYQCAFCEASFLHKTSLLTHMNEKHEHTEEILFPCSHCEKAFSTISQLKRHERTHGLGGPESFFHCEICDKPFTDKGNLNKHMVVHTGVKKYQCDICGKHYTTAGGLLNHKNLHLNLRPFKCSFCIKSFTNKSALRGHERVHTGETPYVCDICGWKFKDKSHLNRHNKSHMKSDQVRPYRCHTAKCGKMFTSLELLNKHVASSHIKNEKGVVLLQDFT